ncbi:MAG: alpha/beta hydrolase [Flavobacteriaceae bacterium]
MKDNSISVPKKEVFEIPSKLIKTGKFIQFFSSSLATNFAMKIFRTPPQFKTPEREEMMQKSAKNELISIPEINKDVMIYSYGYSKTKILLTHGWAGRGTQLYEIADKLLENGMMIISFDAPAHGQSSGTTTNLPEYVTCIHHINEKYGPFDAAIGHSFGGIALLAAEAKKPFLKKLAVIGIESSIRNIIDEFVKKLQLKPKVADKMEHNIRNIFKTDINSVSSSETAKKVSIPTFVVHDTEDYDVDVSSAFKIRQNLQKGQILVTNGLGHRRILRDHKVINTIIDFLKE